MNSELKTTNYFNTFIEIADDCSASSGVVPKVTGEKRTVAALEYELIINNPYKFSCDDVLFEVYASRNNVLESDREMERRKFFSKGQACFRASPLTKSYGWGLHCDKDGKIALYGVNSDEYKSLAQNPNIRHLKAVRSRRL